jgi:outer membrane protein TolC
VFIGAFTIIAGCESYQARPLVPSEIIARVESERHVLLQTEAQAPAEAGKHEEVPLSFTRAIELLRTHSPTVEEVQAEYQTALALAKVSTPLPNPSFDAGPRFGFGPVVTRRFVEPFGSISFTIPLGKRLKRQDELNRLQAELARVQVAARFRELYLDLRRQYSQLVIARMRHAVRQNIGASAETSLTLTKRLVDAGQATALDLGLLELEIGRIKSDALSADGVVQASEGDLSALVGVHSETFARLPEAPLPQLPENLPDIKQLRETLIANNLDLARLRSRYDVAEAQLRLDIAKQYPDLRFGPSGEHDIPDPKVFLGLSLGIDLPLFDRNQQGIATARGVREEVRMKYEAAANRALASLDRAWQKARIAMERLKLLKILQPKAQSNIDLAKKSLGAGATDLLHYLETERTQRSVLVDALDAEQSAREAWIEMENIVGYPLLLFPGEAENTAPPQPPAPPDLTAGEQSGVADDAPIRHSIDQTSAPESADATPEVPETEKEQRND